MLLVIMVMYSIRFWSHPESINQWIVLCPFVVCIVLTVITVVIDQDDLFHQVSGTFLQDAEAWWRKRKGEGRNKTPGSQYLHLFMCNTNKNHSPTWQRCAAERSGLHCGRWWPHSKLAGLTSTAYVCNCARTHAHTASFSVNLYV